MKDGAHIINLDEYKSIGKYKSIGTQWVALYVSANNEMTSHKSIYFDSFGDEHIPREIQKFIISKNAITNIYRFKHIIQ